MLISPSITNAEAELEAMQKWVVLSQVEEAFFLQRSRVQWTGLRDIGTRFFHRMVETIRASNHIHFLTDDLGVRYDSQDGIEQHCIGYFKDLLGKPIAPPLFVQSDLDLLYDFHYSAEDSEKFTMRFTAEEIKARSSRFRKIKLVVQMVSPLSSSQVVGLSCCQKSLRQCWSSSPQAPY